MDLSRYSFSSILGNKTNTSSCQRKVGICPSALITAIARGCCSSFYQCWIWPWSKMCLCNPSWSQIAGSFSFFILLFTLRAFLRWQHLHNNNHGISESFLQNGTHIPLVWGSILIYVLVSVSFILHVERVEKVTWRGIWWGEGRQACPRQGKWFSGSYKVCERVDVLLPNPKGGWNSLLGRGWAQRPFATKKGWVKTEVICRPCCQRVDDSYGMVLLRIIRGGSAGPSWLSSPQAVQDMHSLKPCRSSVDLIRRCRNQWQSSHLDSHYNRMRSNNICRSPPGYELQWRLH